MYVPNCQKKKLKQILAVKEEKQKAVFQAQLAFFKNILHVTCSARLLKKNQVSLKSAMWELLLKFWKIPQKSLKKNSKSSESGSKNYPEKGLILYFYIKIVVEHQKKKD